MSKVLLMSGSSILPKWAGDYLDRTVARAQEKGVEVYVLQLKRDPVCKYMVKKHRGFKWATLKETDEWDKEDKVMIIAGLLEGEARDIFLMVSMRMIEVYLIANGEIYAKARWKDGD